MSRCVDDLESIEIWGRETSGGGSMFDIFLHEVECQSSSQKCKSKEQLEQLKANTFVTVIISKKVYQQEQYGSEAPVAVKTLQIPFTLSQKSKVMQVRVRRTEIFSEDSYGSLGFYENQYSFYDMFVQ